MEVVPEQQVDEAGLAILVVAQRGRTQPGVEEAGVGGGGGVRGEVRGEGVNSTM